MGLKKCPICELNYIRDDQKYCEVCARAQKNMKHLREQEELESLCIECGENPAVEGSDLCAECLREARRQEKLKSKESLSEEDVLGLDGLDAMEVPLLDDEDDDIPPSEMEEIDMELGSSDDEDEDEDLDEE